MPSTYSPETTPDISTPDKLTAYLQREFLNISKALDRASTIELDPQFVAPAKPIEGVVYYADGTSWNPGSGEGYYGYINSVWVKLDNNFAAGGLIIPSSANPTPTVEGDARWDSDDDALIIGDGASQAIFRQSNWERIGPVINVTSSVASIIWNNLGIYRSVRFAGRLNPVTNAVNLRGHVSSDNGASWLAGASEYALQYHYATGAAPNATSGANAYLQMTLGDVHNSLNYGQNFDLVLHEWNTGVHANGFLDTFNLTSGSVYYISHIGVDHNNSIGLNAFRLIMSSGNIANGYVFAEGIRG